MDREWLANLLAEGYSLERIGRLAGKHPATVGYWVERHGLAAAHRDKYAPKGGLSEERLRALAEAGLSMPSIAVEVDRSVPTVRYWLERYGLQTDQAQRMRLHRKARSAGLAELEILCGRHGKVRFRKETTGRYRCVRCNSEAVSHRRRRVKEILVDEAGGSCALCGYDRYPGALHFHHLDPASKAFMVGHEGNTRSLERLRSEVSKCVLLCANCHAEIEAGIATLPSGGGTGGA